MGKFRIHHLFQPNIFSSSSAYNIMYSAAFSRMQQLVLQKNFQHDSNPSFAKYQDFSLEDLRTLGELISTFLTYFMSSDKRKGNRRVYVPITTLYCSRLNQWLTSQRVKIHHQGALKVLKYFNFLISKSCRVAFNARKRVKDLERCCLYIYYTSSSWFEVSAMATV